MEYLVGLSKWVWKSYSRLCVKKVTMLRLEPATCRSRNLNANHLDHRASWQNDTTVPIHDQVVWGAMMPYRGYKHDVTSHYLIISILYITWCDLTLSDRLYPLYNMMWPHYLTVCILYMTWCHLTLPLYDMMSPHSTCPSVSIILLFHF